MTDDIIILSTINNKSYIGKVLDYTSKTITLDRPFRVAIDNDGALMLFPFDSLSKDDNVKFLIEHILYATNPRDNVIKFYLKHKDKYYDYNGDPPSEASVTEELATELLNLLSSNTMKH